MKTQFFKSKLCCKMSFLISTLSLPKKGVNGQQIMLLSCKLNFSAHLLILIVGFSPRLILVRGRLDVVGERKPLTGIK